MNQSNKINWITGLKGWCCLTVVMLHLLACLYPCVLCAKSYIEQGVYNLISLTPMNILFNGSFSVYIFWTISAFLIAVGWYRNHSLEDMSRKMLNKYFRIILPIIICSVVAFVLIKCNLYFNVEAGEIIESSFFSNERDYLNVTWKTLIADILFYDFFGASKVMLIPPLWTMKIEFLGSGFTVLLLILFGDKKKRDLLYIFLIIILTITAPTYVCFVIGIKLADIYMRKTEENCIWKPILYLCLGILLGAYPPSGVPESGIYHVIYENVIVNYNEIMDVITGVHTLYVFAAALILLAIVKGVNIRKIYENRIFEYLGERSLYIYLLHVPVIFSATAYIFVHLNECTEQYFVAVVISWIATFVITLVLVEALKHVDERYLSCLSKKIVNYFME